MLILIFLTAIGGGLIMAGTSYPYFAALQPNWKQGEAENGEYLNIWYFFGSLAYLAGSFSLLGWIGLLAAVPSAFVCGFALTMLIGQNIKFVARLGPVLANVWFFIESAANNAPPR